MVKEDHKLAAIVFTDIVGYTKQMEENEVRTMQLLQKQREILFPLVKSFGGEVIKEIGDGLMMMFGSAVEAVRFAIAAQNRLKDEELTIRAGIHIGDVIFRDGDVFGSAVNTAARIEPLAPPNGICISEDVRSQLQNKTDIEVIPLGKKILKGVKSPVPIYEVYIDGITAIPKKSIGFFIKDLWNRAVIQIIMVYLASAWVLRLAVSAIVDNYMLSPHLVDLTWVILLSLLPTVFLLSYYHGRRKTSRWTRVEQIGFPVNALLTIGLVVTLFQGKDLGATTTTLTVENEKGEKITRTILKDEFRKKLAIFFFENQSGDTALNWLQYGWATALTFDISQDLLIDATNTLNYIDKIRESGYQDGMGTPLMLKRKIAEYYHKNFFTTGSYDFNNDTWEVTLKVYDSGKGNLLKTLNFENENLFALTDEMTVGIKKAVGMSDTQIESAVDLPIKDVSTASYDAFKYYIESLVEIKLYNNWSKGLELAEKSITIDNDFAIAHLTIAEYYFNSNMPEKARKSIQVTMDKIYNLPERNQFYARFFYYMIDQNAEQANKVMKMYTELYPEDITARVSLAQRYLLKNDFKNAIQQYKTIMQLVPDEYEYLRMTGDIYEKAGMYDSSLYYYKQYAQHFPNDFLSYKNIGDSYVMLADFEKARENYENALLIEPDNTIGIANLVSIDMREGKLDKALERLNLGIKRCKTPNDSINILSSYENYYKLLGKANLAFDYSQQLFDIYDRIMPPLRRMVFRVFFISNYIDVGRSDEALAIIQKIESEFQPPLDKIAAFGYLFYYVETENPEKAKSYVEDAMVLIEGFGEQTLLPNIYWAEAKIAEMEGNYEEAINKIKAYGEISKGAIAKYRWLARNYRKLGDYKEAEKNIQEALRRFPGDPENLYEAGMIEKARGNKTKAVEYLQKANEIWKDADDIYPAAKKARKALEELITA